MISPLANFRPRYPESPALATMLRSASYVLAGGLWTDEDGGEWHRALAVPVERIGDGSVFSGTMAMVLVPDEAMTSAVVFRLAGRRSTYFAAAIGDAVLAVPEAERLLLGLLASEVAS